MSESFNLVLRHRFTLSIIPWSRHPKVVVLRKGFGALIVQLVFSPACLDLSTSWERGALKEP